MGNELFEKQAAQKMFAHIAKKAKEEPSNYGWKLLDFTFNKMSSQYETYDQKFKLTSFIRSTVDGYTVDQLQQMRSIVNIAPEEITAHKWQFDGRYAMRFEKLENGKFKKIYLHIAIAKPESGMLVDHEDQNRLNNRVRGLPLQRRNLRYPYEGWQTRWHFFTEPN